MLQTFLLGGRSVMLQIFRGRSAMLQIFLRGEVCNVADLPGGGLQRGRSAMQHRHWPPLCYNCKVIDKCIHSKYMCLTIVSCFGKLFTSVLNERLQTFSEQYNLICENQAGFRKDYSTLDNIFLLHTLISLSNLFKKKLYCIFIDFEKSV